jgi:hypothetical protein
VAAVAVGVIVIGAQGSSHPNSPRSLEVVVLNATSITGLAHRLSRALQKAGYSKSTALDAQPPGSYPATLVEYKRGNRPAAQAVAHALHITHEQAMSSSLSSLRHSATIAVVAGDDQTQP